MTTEDAIKILNDGKWWDHLDSYPPMHIILELTNALEMAENALRAQQEAEKNEPLTLEELREMNGEPVWTIFTLDSDGECLTMWELVSVDKESKEVFLQNSIGGRSAYDEICAYIKAIYRRKPKEE